MLASFFSTTDQLQFRAPVAWDFEIYTLDPRSFWYSKAVLPVAQGFELVRYDFRGRVRFRAALSAPKLQINFIDSYSSIDSRLQGRGKIESVVMVTIGGNAWDGLTDVGALGIELNFDETLTSRILTPELQHALNGMVSRERSVIGPVTPCGQQLKSMAQRHLTRMDEASGLFAPELIGQSRAMTEVDLMDRPDLRDVDETFAEMARTLLEELAFANHPSQEVSTGRRREIALQVEAMLWEPPFLHEESFSATLDEFAQIFSVSTRTIQIAIQEQFGMGFVALRRLIRLTQLRRAILDSNGAASLSSLASDYKLHFGRLAQEYSQLFGIKPSQELRQLRKAQSDSVARLRRAD